MQWSAPKTGWLERNWIKAGVQYTRVDGMNASLLPSRIKTGVVLDAVGRSLHCFTQINQLLLAAENGILTSNDVIYFDDFWTPGLESLPYAFHLLGIKPRMYAFLFAQSVDEFDFTYPMRGWMRHFEKGIAQVLDGIFVACPYLKDLVTFGGIAPPEKVHVTGHPFSSEEVTERMPCGTGDNGECASWVMERENKVVFSSRWDREKNPVFFLQVVDNVLQRTPNAKFVLCTGSKELRSNNLQYVELARTTARLYPGRFIIKENLTKEQYYAELCSAKIQINTADQDFVPLTLLESSVAGCYPIYPYFRSFPETFLYKPGYMYDRLNVDDCSRLVMDVLGRNDLWTEEAIQSRAWIHNRFDTSWIRMLEFLEPGNSIIQQANYTDDPFARHTA